MDSDMPMPKKPRPAPARKCFVPICKNDSWCTPKKVFIFVPRNPTRREVWFQAVGLPLPPVKSVRYCCEDHFNMKKDSFNLDWYKHKYKHGGDTSRITLKEDVIPHLYIHQTAPAEMAQRSQVVSSSSSESSSSEEREKTFPTPAVIQEPEARPSTSGSSSSHFESGPSTSSLSTSEVALDPSFEVSKQLTSEDDSSDETSADKHFKKLSKEREILAINKNPRFYLGLPEDVYMLVQIIQRRANLLERDILITLKKIRLNDQFLRLSLDFGLSVSYISKIFHKTVYPLSDVLSPFIYWPDSVTIKRFLPITFRLKYRDVVSIIDCFEISTEKPSDPLKQAMTWSSYKSANTVKFLISCTPYGLVNFVSTGFSGRTSDVCIVENSKYLHEIPENTSVLADRGFKHLTDVFSKKNITLIRPASVSEGTSLSEETIKESRDIAALRIHIERVISRIREFHFLSPHANVDVHLVPTLNAAVKIACGIINVQPQLIRIMEMDV